ncbi:MAG: enoyl-CoA hydratase-related protein [Minwuia sp.]|nr:enoyl-CoA hydratase-related protein [Minwuia sp.]
MAEEPLLIDIRDGVAWMTMNRPAVLNGLDRGLTMALWHGFEAVERDTTVRAIVLTGAGRAFCSGADLSLLKRLTESDGRPGDLVAAAIEAEFNPMMRALAALSKPVIAAVNGPAAGGGASLALACDIVIAARSSYFQLTFGPNLGIVPDLGGSWLFPRHGGRSRGLGMALTGDRLSGPDAADQGLIWECAYDDKLLERAGAIADRLAKGPTRAYDLIKQALRHSQTATLDEQLAEEREMQRTAGATADFAEGVAAFIEKRPAAFKGR